jgi:hypothetical protein
MNKLFALCLGLVLLGVTGCRTRYDITLTNGTKISGVSKPHLDTRIGYYIYQDAQGRTNGVPSMRVSVIEPQGMISNDDGSSRKNKKKPKTGAY